jgi:hypothetical protein
MVTTVLNLIIKKVKSSCELRDLYADIYRTKLATPQRRESLANEKIRSRRRPIAAGYRGGRSRSVKSHYKAYEKPQYTIKVMLNFI